MASLTVPQQLTSEHIAALDDEIRQHEHAVASIDEKLYALQRDMTLLRVRKNEHSVRISRCKGILTLARRLPPEILVEIFNFCTAEGWHRAPLVLSRVCSAWFQASRFPRVWSHLYIDCEDASVLGRTRLWIEMAKGVPLAITLRTSVHDSITRAVLSLLTPLVRQWLSFTVDTATVEDAETILSGCPRDLLLLEELTVKTLGNPFPGGQNNPLQLDSIGEVFQDAKKLTRLSFACNSLNPLSTVPPQLVELSITINAIAIDELANIEILARVLRDLPLLKTFDMTVSTLPDDGDWLGPPADFPPVTLPSLETMSLRVPPTFTSILQPFETPCLLNFSLRSSGEPLGLAHNPTGECLTQFFTRSSPPLQLLELYDIDIPGAAFSACFAALPALQELRLHWTEVSDDVFRKLCGPDALCQRLTRLDLRWCEQLSGAVLVDMVRSRNAARKMKGALTSDGLDDVQPVQEVAVLNCSFVEEKDVLALASMVVCRITLRQSDDPCRSRGCCSNSRYRQRFRLRHTKDLAGKKLILS